jgi:hypothetical protein
LRRCDVAGEGEHLDLLVHGDPQVVLVLPVEVAEHDLAEGADAAEAGRRQRVVPGEAQQSVHQLVPGLEDEHEAPLGA